MQNLYSNLKPFRFPEHLDAIRERRLLAPVHIRIKPMNHCNHDCWYCAYRVSNLQLGKDMDVRDKIPESKMFEIVDDMIDMGVKAATFSGGGEPLLYKPLPEVIRRLAKGNIRIGSLSNGSNLKGKVAEAFATYATWVRISIDGWDGKSYAEQRRIKEDSFDKLIYNMRNFVALKSKCVLGVSFIVDNNNYQHVYEACELFKDIGVNHVKLSGVVISNEGSECNAYHSALVPDIDQQIEAAKALSNETFTVLDHYHELEERFDRPYHICPNIQLNPVIGGDCIVYTCHDKAFNSNGALGSIKSRSFKDFWYSEETRTKIYAVNPSKDCLHHCADDKKNRAILNFLGTDPEHELFV